MLAGRWSIAGYKGLHDPHALRKKRDSNDCENYNDISPLRIVGKVFAQFFLIRFHKLAEIVYPESQYASELSSQR